MPACVIAGVVIVGESDTPVAPAQAGSNALARPKSSTFPSLRANLHIGRFQVAVNYALRVRGFEASAICFAIGSASSIEMGLCAMRSASVGPSTSSITRAFRPSASSTP